MEVNGTLMKVLSGKLTRYIKSGVWPMTKP